MNTTIYSHLTGGEEVTAIVDSLDSDRHFARLAIGQITVFTKTTDTLGESVENLKALRLSIDRAIRDAVSVASKTAAGV